MDYIMDTWCQTYEKTKSGGKMRGDRGDDIEKFVTNYVNYIGKCMGKELHAISGKNDKKLLKIEGKSFAKEHQVDVHIYLGKEFKCVIECKSYLDSCYYVRACDDFKLFKKFGYQLKNFIFALEDSIAQSNKEFTDYVNDYICDDVFYILDGKRSANKPIYERSFRKSVNVDKMRYFINKIINI